jgi:hypothetical protein
MFVSTHSKPNIEIWRFLFFKILTSGKMKTSKINSFLNFEFLMSLFGEISPKKKKKKISPTSQKKKVKINFLIFNF